MKKLFTIFCVLLLALPLAVADLGPDMKEKNLEVAQLHVDWQELRILVGMQTTIQYVDELGGDTTNLESLRDSFQSLADETVSTRDELTALNSEKREVTSSFKEDAVSQVTDLGGDLDVLRERIESARDESPDVQAAKEAFVAKMQEVILGRVDLHLERMQDLIDTFDQNNIDTTELNVIYDNVLTLRTELETTIGTGDKEAVKDLLSQVREEGKAFNELLQSLRQDLAAQRDAQVEDAVADARERLLERQEEPLQEPSVGDEEASEGEQETDAEVEDPTTDVVEPDVETVVDEGSEEADSGEEAEEGGEV